MSRNRGNRTKQGLGQQTKLSEFDDELLRNHKRSNNRLKTHIQIQDRAHKVIMKDLGRESSLLQTKLENDRKIVSLGLYGHKFGTASPRNVPRYTPSSPTGKQVSSGMSLQTPTQSMSFSKTAEKRFPWDPDPVDKESAVEKDSVLSNKTSMTKNSARLKTLLARYPSSRAQSDDFLSTLLNDAMNDELLYTKSPEMRSPSVTNQEEPRTARRRKTRSQVESSSGSIVNALNVRETEPVYQ